MKKSIILTMLCGMMAVLASCNGGKTQKSDSQKDSAATTVADTAVYGKCGEGCAMHTLQLITDDGKTIEFTIDEDMGSDVQGGMMEGDRMAVTYFVSNANGQEEKIAHKVVNLTTLLGHWTSLDKNFTINEDGSVESKVQAESKPYTAWSVVNARLVLNTDTFDVTSLGADSLELENNKGIFAYKRQE